jgi:acetyl esterase/lipase
MDNLLRIIRSLHMSHKNALALSGLVAAVLALPVVAQQAGPTTRPVEMLWPQGAPGAVGEEAVDKPTLTVYLPPEDKATGTAVVICPGGGYGHLAVDHEGRQIAEWLNSLGVAGFILQYRIAPRYRHPAPLQDAQRAIRTVRARAGEWKIDPGRIGIIGFSAGGHLASTAATHFDDARPATDDPIEQVSPRPDFLILCYPVITFGERGRHTGSMRNLLGQNPDPALVENLSNEKQVTPQSPPTFLFHTTDDSAVPAENSVLFYLALKKAGVPAELHIYERGRHGVGLARDDRALRSWPVRCAEWLRGHGWLDPRPRQPLPRTPDEKKPARPSRPLTPVTPEHENNP